MNSSAILDIGVQTLIICAKLCAPFLITALVIGFAIGLLQSVTQIQEATLSFVPKLIGIAIALVICSNWMIGSLVTFTHELFDKIPSLLNG